MPEFSTLSCPSCGAKLQIGNNIDRFACSYCGNEHIVERTGGIVTLSPVVEEIKHIHICVDKTASELALKRLTQESEDLKQRLDYEIRKYNEANKNKGCHYGFLLLIFVTLVILCSMASVLHVGDPTASTPDIRSIQERVGTIGGLVIFLLIIGFFYTRTLVTNKQNRDLEERIRPYRDSLTRNQREIEHHKKIVKLD